MYDNYHETEYTPAKVHKLFNEYLRWCVENNEAAEITALEFVNESNIGHIAYHANLLND
jgi:hypothetical protein